MKRFAVLLVALLLAGVIGCDGDGGGDAVGSEDPPTDVPDTGPEGIILSRGSVTLPAGPSSVLLTTFSVSEPGTLEGRLVWGDETAILTSDLILNGVGSIEDKTSSSSPFSISADVTQDLVDLGINWSFRVINNTPVVVDLEYRVMFTPN